MKYILLIATCALAISCKQEMVPELNAATYIADWDGKAPAEYTNYLSQALDNYGSAMFDLKEPKDMSDFCPKFSKMQRDEKKQVFIMLISAMAKRESGFKTSTSYVESFKGSDGKNVVSRGLLQISQSSSNQSAYKCGTTKADMLYDPKFNLECGVKILNYWTKDNAFGGSNSDPKRGAGRYWSVMRPGNSQNYIKSRVKSLKICN